MKRRCTLRLLLQTQKRNSASNRSFTPRVDHLDLEDDDDIRVLLDRVRAASLPRPATSSGKPSRKTRPVSGNPYGRSQAKVNPPPTKGGSPAERCEGFMRRPKSAGMHGWARSLDGRKTDPSDVVQLRRELLIRSHGEGRNLRLFPTEPFETTAMGRKACCMDPGRGTEVRSLLHDHKTLVCLDQNIHTATEVHIESHAPPKTVSCRDAIFRREKPFIRTFLCSVVVRSFP